MAENHFILLHRIMKDQDKPVATWVNVSNINTIAESLTVKGTRITMRDGFLLVADTVSEVLDKIKEANDDHVRITYNRPSVTYDG